MAATAKQGLEIRAKAVMASAMCPADRQAIDARSPTITTTKPTGMSTTATTPGPNDTFGSVGLSWTAISPKRGGTWLHCVASRRVGLSQVPRTEPVVAPLPQRSHQLKSITWKPMERRENGPQTVGSGRGCCSGPSRARSGRTARQGRRAPYWRRRPGPPIQRKIARTPPAR